MSYTVTAARWANADSDSAILQTKEAGAVVAHEGHPEAWKAFQVWLVAGNKPEPYVAPIQKRKRPQEAILKDIQALSEDDRSRLLTGMCAAYLAEYPSLAKDMGIDISGDEIEV